MLAKEDPLFTYSGVFFLRMTSFTFFLPFTFGLNKGERIFYGAAQISSNQTSALSVLTRDFKIRKLGSSLNKFNYSIQLFINHLLCI